MPPADPMNEKFSKSHAAPGESGAALIVPVTGGKLAGQVVRARFLASPEDFAGKQPPFRPQFSQWVVSHENPWFGANAVNRLWAGFFGRGLMEPLDAFSADRPPAESAVLAFLARELANSGFDLKHLIRSVVSSRAYQRTSQATSHNQADTERFSHMAVKPLRPEMLYDSLCVVLYPRAAEAGCEAAAQLSSSLDCRRRRGRSSCGPLPCGPTRRSAAR